MSPPFGAVTNRLPFIAASLRCSIHRRRFFVKYRRDAWVPPYGETDSHANDTVTGVGMTALQGRADGASYPKGICSAALHCRTPSPTKSQRGRCKKGGQVSALYIPIIYDSAQRHDAL